MRGQIYTWRARRELRLAKDEARTHEAHAWRTATIERLKGTLISGNVSDLLARRRRVDADQRGADAAADDAGLGACALFLSLLCAVFLPKKLTEKTELILLEISQNASKIAFSRRCAA